MKPKKSAALWVLILGLAVWAEPGVAIEAPEDSYDWEQEEAMEEGDGEVGECGLLLSYTRERLDQMTSLEYSDQFETFCRPKAPRTCSFYNMLFHRYGALLPSMEGEFCRFIPQEWINQESLERSLGSSSDEDVRGV